MNDEDQEFLHEHKACHPNGKPLMMSTIEQKRYPHAVYARILRIHADLAAQREEPRPPPGRPKRSLSATEPARKRPAVQSSSSKDDDTSTATEIRCSLCNELIDDDNGDGEEHYCKICFEIGSELKSPDRIKALVYNVHMKQAQPRTRFTSLSFWDFAKMTNEEDHVNCLLNQKQYEDLVRSPCEYCLLTPAGHATRRSPAGDYAIDTVVSCCPLCLELKGNLRHSLFTRQVTKIAQFYEQSLL